MELPNVIGFAVDDALAEISKQGFTVESLCVTKPVKATEPLGIARVIRLSLTGETELRVVVAYQDYVKGGVQYGIQNNR